MRKVLFFIALIISTIANAQKYYIWINNHVEYQDEDSITFSLPENAIILATGEPSKVTDSSMTATYVLSKSISISYETINKTEFGICYSYNNSYPTAMDITTKVGSYMDGGSVVTINKLIPGITYNYRPYVHIGNQYFYGEVKSFTTTGKKPETQPKYVDLGLSVKWASCNIGANYPFEYGNYYSWGETVTKTSYTWNNYLWGDYNDLSKYNSKDGKKILDQEDDVANIVCGNYYRIPSKEEVDELIDSCTWEQKKLYGRNGFVVTGRNGNSIFLPFTSETTGRYWINAIYRDQYNIAYTLVMNKDIAWTSYDSRYCGLSIRSVCLK